MRFDIDAGPNADPDRPGPAPWATAREVGEPEGQHVPGVPMVLGAAGLVSVTALVLSLVLAGAGPEPAPAGLPDPGVGSAWALRTARLLMDLTAVMTIGC